MVLAPETGKLELEPGKLADDGLFFASVIQKPSSCVPRDWYYGRRVGAGPLSFLQPKRADGCKGRARRSLHGLGRSGPG